MDGTDLSSPRVTQSWRHFLQTAETMYSNSTCAMAIIRRYLACDDLCMSKPCIFWTDCRVPVTACPAATMNAGSLLRIRSACPQRSLRCYSNRKFLIGGNWKCNGTVESVKTLVSDLNAGSVPSDVDIVCAPVFIHLPYVLDNLSSRFAVSAQNCWTAPGAFTGEVSADMLVDMGVPWVITGHSERRALIGETCQHVGEKSAYAINKGLNVIACVGESLPERESGRLWDVLSEQMSGLKDSLSMSDWSKVVIAYEPVWAIGTGVIATPDQAQVRRPQPHALTLLVPPYNFYVSSCPTVGLLALRVCTCRSQCCSTGPPA